MKTFLRYGLQLFAVLALLAGASAARADSLYNFSMSGPGITSSGIVSVAPGNTQPLPITGMTGELNGQAITLDPVNTWGANDNLYSPFGGPFVDDFGVTFDAGGTTYNLYSWADTYYLAWDSTWTAVDFEDDPIQTPETSSLALLGLGLLGLGAAFGFKRAYKFAAIEA